MAKETLVLMPSGLSGSGLRMFQYSYYDSAKRKQVNFLVNGTVYEGSLAIGRDPNQQREEKKISFDATNLKYSISYDTDEKTSADYIEAQFIINHPNVFSSSGKQNANYSGKTLWIAELQQQSIENSYNDMLKRLDVMNTFLKMSPYSWRECAFRFGVNPTKKGPHEIAAELVNTKNGVILQTIENCEEFFKWKSTFHKDDPKSVAEKASALGIIKRDNETYKFDNNPIGRTIDEVTAALTADRTTLRQVIKDIDSNDYDLADYIERVELHFPKEYDSSGSIKKVDPINKEEVDHVSAALESSESTSRSPKKTITA
jgi:hypothetical protein